VASAASAPAQSTHPCGQVVRAGESAASMQVRGQLRASFCSRFRGAAQPQRRWPEYLDVPTPRAMVIGAVRTEEKFEFAGCGDQSKLRAHNAELGTFPTASTKSRASYRWAFPAVLSLVESAAVVAGHAARRASTA
jgi:hypothetical protein